VTIRTPLLSHSGCQSTLKLNLQSIHQWRQRPRHRDCCSEACTRRPLTRDDSIGLAEKVLGCSDFGYSSSKNAQVGCLRASGVASERLSAEVGAGDFLMWRPEVEPGVDEPRSTFAT
jgi:hypothetical protein